MVATRARVQLEPGYVLSAKPYGDSSLLIEIFTPAHGRLGLVARGARGPKSRTRVLLQMLQPLLLSWIEGGELGTLSAVEAHGHPPDLAGERVFYGWYLNELLLKLVQRRDPHPQLFDAYVEALQRIAGEHAQAGLRFFEMRLLAETGYGLHLDDDIDAATHYRLDADGALRAAPASASSYSGASLMALAQDRLDTPQALADARKILRAALRLQLGGRELETPKMLRELRDSKLA